MNYSGIVDFIKSHKVLSACATAAVVYSAWFFKRPRNLPPGPWGYPIVGSVSDIMKVQEGSFEALGKKYGDVFTLWLGGNTYWIVLGSYEAIKEAYITRGTEFYDRDTERLGDLFQDDLIFNARYDERYKSARKVTSQGMRMVLNTKLQGILEKNIDYLEEALSHNDGKPLKLEGHFGNIFVNSMLSLLLGTQYHPDDEEFVETKKLIKTFAVSLFDSMGALSIPILCGKWIMAKQIKTTKKLMEELMDVFGKFVEEHEKSIDSASNRDMIDVYLNSQGPITFCKKNISETLMAFIPDTTLTSVEMAMWMVLYLVNHPQCQEDIYDEIQHVCGSEEISLKKRPEMPITESFIMEVFRIVNPVDVGVLGKPVQTTMFRGYNIPENAVIAPHYGGVLRSPKFFPEPEIFKPKRYLKDGKIDASLPFISFGMGRRMCVGEHFVRSSLFFIVARIVSRYKLESPDGGKLNTAPENASFVKKPKEFSVIMKERIH